MIEPIKMRVGTRASALARWQADWVAQQLRAAGHDVELVFITTKGDVTTGPLSQGSGRGLFTKQLQYALLELRIDLAVHSLKDLPTEPVSGLTLAAVPPRAAAADVLVAREAASFDDLPRGARVGTGSPRRRAQLLHARPDLVVLDIRGNVDTRLRKLDEGQYEGIILAEAGLRRLGLAERITQILPMDLMLPAVGQGALGLEVRADDAAARAAVAELNDPTTYAAVLAERRMLAALQGGCLAPVGAWCRSAGERLCLDGRVLDAKGRNRLDAAAAGPIDDPLALGDEVARLLLGEGAATLITRSRGESV